MYYTTIVAKQITDKWHVIYQDSGYGHFKVLDLVFKCKFDITYISDIQYK